MMAPPLTRAGRTLTVFGWERHWANDTVIVFHGLSRTGRHVRFAVDHRLAQDLVDALDGDEEVVVVVEPWQVLTSTRKTTPGEEVT